ncbi:TetR/AcrR family transcriptional regulator [Rhodococcus sp. IEGM 1330]|uniref:TetR/AcrR family transcriptional regulator n=1 Tax=Rhodococcus sp. IEGM 1330 TaxID=3082225 RepID=UPI00295598D6|nr:TetR/AcrR family transcriptional regulator [Rhodococcus sp. IEGM 1330]MDV8024848.1 TetR/AcrR family transcriptional regulator [Rhodococcus sp. IEGM 1330]
MSETGTTAQRRRPRNRKAQILVAAAEAFSERGYHPVGIEDIAATVGISGPALYRHFPTKYSLFVDTVMRMTDSLVAATDPAVIEVEDPQARIDAVIGAIIATTIDNRRTGGLYRWEGRYLVGSDREYLRRALRTVHERVTVPLRQVRPDLSEADAALLATASISVVASITAHRSALSSKQIEESMLAAARSVLRTELPQQGSESPHGDSVLEHVSKREELLHHSIRLFYLHGYHEVCLDDIGAAASITASSVYRYFPSKAELLEAALHRANAQLTDTLAGALEQSNSPVDAVRTFARLYTELTFRQGELVAVYFAEIGNLQADRRTTLRRIQRHNIDGWAQLLRQARPNTSVVVSRFLIHAALGLVFDVGRTVRFERSDRTMARVQQTMTAVLLG